MKPSEQDRLLRELLDHERLEEVRRASLSGGLEALRQRRQRRAVFARVSTVAAVMLMATAFAVRRHANTAANLTPTPAESLPVKIIDDRQLLALFPDRSVALIGPPGKQQLLFLDAPELARTAAK